MKNLLIVLLTFIASIAFAQQPIIWIGGTPGQENNWQEARNWSTNRIPDAFSNVLIPDVSTTTFSNPCIKTGKIEVNTLTVESNAQLKVEAGATIIVYDYIEGFFEDDVILEGTLLVMEEKQDLFSKEDKVFTNVEREKE